MKKNKRELLEEIQQKRQHSYLQTHQDRKNFRLCFSSNWMRNLKVKDTTQHSCSRAKNLNAKYAELFQLKSSVPALPLSAPQ